MVGLAVRHEFTTVGEGGLRFTPVPGSSLEDATCFEMDIVGSEANVAAGLARLGRRAGWVSSLPDNVVGARVEAAVRDHGVDTSRVVWSNGTRVSLYYSERSEVSLGRGGDRSVLYDRADSAFCRLTPDQIDWDYLMDTRWLHVTGITMAVSSSVRAVIEQAVTAARAAGVLVSLDVNYRPALWAAREAESALLPLLGSVDLLFCPARDARAVFGLTGSDDEVLDGLAAITAARKIVMSLGADGSIAVCDSQRLSHRGCSVVVVDRAGAGDALAAGVLHGLLDGDLARGLAYGTALASLVLSRRGEQVDITADELDRLTAAPSHRPR